MNRVFKIVYDFLKWISETSGFTYREVNILIYFVLLPFIFLWLIDRILKIKYFRIGFGLLVITALLLIPDFNLFSSSLFDKSVDFLNWFEIIGLNYIQASVVICVILPLIIICVLILFNKKRNS